MQLLSFFIPTLTLSIYISSKITYFELQNSMTAILNTFVEYYENSVLFTRSIMFRCGTKDHRLLPRWESDGGYVQLLFRLPVMFTWCTIQRNLRLLLSNTEKTSESILWTNAIWGRNNYFQLWTTDKRCKRATYLAISKWQQKGTLSI